MVGLRHSGLKTMKLFRKLVKCQFYIHRNELLLFFIENKPHSKSRILKTKIALNLETKSKWQMFFSCNFVCFSESPNFIYINSTWKTQFCKKLVDSLLQKIRDITWWIWQWIFLDTFKILVHSVLGRTVVGKCRDDGSVEEQGEQIVIDWCLGKASRAGGNSIIRLHKIRAKLILIYLSGSMQNHHGKHKLFRVRNNFF